MRGKIMIEGIKPIKVMQLDHTEELMDDLEKNANNENILKIQFPDHVVYYFFTEFFQIAFFDASGKGHYIPPCPEELVGTWYAHNVSYEDMLNYTEDAPHKESLLKLLDKGLLEELSYTNRNDYIVKEDEL